MENLTLSGASSVSGGIYGSITMSGACKITSDTECSVFKCSGASKVEGNLKCENFHASGANDVAGNVECEELFKCAGATSVGGVYAKNVHMSGASKSRGDITADYVHTSGTVTVGGNLTAETVNGSGALNVKGDINAENFVFDMAASAANSSANTIGGTYIKIMRKEPEYGIFNNIINSIFNNGKPSVFTADEIEGDKIALQGVYARVVRGNEIDIGEDCRIKRVEYTGKVTFTENAEIGELVEL